MFPGGLINELIKGVTKFQVKNIAAAAADHMVMRICPSVKTVAAVRSRNLCDLANICKKIKVTVNSSKTDIWKFFPDTGV